MKLLDLFCCAGGAGHGYFLAGYEVTGVDISPQPNHPAHLNFIQADAIAVLDDVDFCRQFDLIHASPPCQRYCPATKIAGNADDHPDFVGIVREKLERIGKPYIIENVPNAPLKNYVMLCGTMFGLQVIRHRKFECFPALYFPPALCNHNGKCNTHRGFSSFARGSKFITVAGHNFKLCDAKIAMKIDWMSQDEIKEAIPPAYTKWLGEQMRPYLLS
jgi:DNA (cytosine-5)-methyltransferase 1